MSANVKRFLENLDVEFSEDKNYVKSYSGGYWNAQDCKEIAAQFLEWAEVIESHNDPLKESLRGKMKHCKSCLFTEKELKGVHKDIFCENRCSYCWAHHAKYNKIGLESIVCMIYTLLRDHIPVGAITTLLHELENLKGDHEFNYTNKELEELARSLVRRFMDLEK